MLATAAFARLHRTAIVILITLLVSLVFFHGWSFLVSFVIVQYCWRWNVHGELEPPEFQAWKEPYEKSSVWVLTASTCILAYNFLLVHLDSVTEALKATILTTVQMSQANARYHDC